jgi:hypothetical protein
MMPEIRCLHEQKASLLHLAAGLKMSILLFCDTSDFTDFLPRVNTETRISRNYLKKLD